MTSSRDGPVRGALAVQHHNAVLRHTVMLHVSAPGEWGGRERGVVEYIADTGCTATVHAARSWAGVVYGRNRQGRFALGQTNAKVREMVRNRASTRGVFHDQTGASHWSASQA